MSRVAPFAYAVALAFAGPACAQTDAQVEARLNPAVHECERSPESGGTMQQALCYKAEAARQDQQLNAVWARVINRLSPTHRDSLRRSERQWIKERDAECHDEAGDYVNSTAAYMFNVCLANETIRRTMWLENAR